MNRLGAAKGVLHVGADARDARAELQFEPRAVMLWWVAGAPAGVSPGNAGGIGFAAHDGGSGSVAWFSQDSVAPARTGHQADEAAFVGLEPESREVSLRGAVAFERTGFALDVTGSAPTPWTVHYLALDVPQVRVDWAVEGGELGFRPDLVLLAPVIRGWPGLIAAFGAATAVAQAATAFVSPDGAAPGAVAGAQRRDAAIVVPANRRELAALGGVTVDDRGFKVQGSASALYLALGGLRSRVGTGESPPEAGRRRSRGVGFRPDALLFFTWGLAARTEPADIGRLCIGAATPGATGCAGWDDRDVAAAVTATHVQSSTEEVLVVTDTQTGDVHAAAAPASFDADGFTLDWTASDGHAREFAYIALAAPSGPPWWRRLYRQRSASSRGS